MTKRLVMPLLIRRLLRQDIEAVRSLYAKHGRDAAWAEEASLHTMLRYGELWGVFCGGGLAVCGGLCPADAQTSFAQAARDTGLVQSDAMLLLPMAGSAALAARLLSALVDTAARRTVQPEAAAHRNTNNADVTAHGATMAHGAATSLTTAPLFGAATPHGAATAHGAIVAHGATTPLPAAPPFGATTPHGATMAHGAATSLTAAPPPTVIAFVPVKTGADFSPACFAQGFALCAVRPLVALRPHYLFFPRAGVQTDADSSIIIALQDTFALSRRLEQGWRGVAQRANDVRMEKMKQ